MKSKPRHYHNEFKQDAVRLVLEDGYSTSEAARNLGVPKRTLHGWVEKERSLKEFEGEELSANERMELKRLKKENHRLRMEREILKKAEVRPAFRFFARENLCGGTPRLSVY